MTGGRVGVCLLTPARTKIRAIRTRPRARSSACGIPVCLFSPNVGLLVYPKFSANGSLRASPSLQKNVTHKPTRLESQLNQVLTHTFRPSSGSPRAVLCSMPGGGAITKAWTGERACMFSCISRSVRVILLLLSPYVLLVGQSCPDPPISTRRDRSSAVIVVDATLKHSCASSLYFLPIVA